MWEINKLPEVVLSKEKIMEMIKSLSPNLHEYQLTLIQSQIAA